MITQDIITLLQQFARQYYNIARQNQPKLPTEQEWALNEVHLFRSNYPELFGYEWDEEAEDWVLDETSEQEDGWLNRLRDRTGKKKK